MASSTSSSTNVHLHLYYPEVTSHLSFLGDKPDSVQVRIDENTNGIAIKQLISEKTGIPLNHLSLQVSNGPVTTYTTHLPTRSGGSPFNSMACGMGGSYTLGDESPVLSALEPSSDRWRVDHTYVSRTEYGTPHLSARVTKCADAAHCPAAVRIRTIGSELFAQPFTSETTVADLKAAIAVKDGIPAENQRLVFGGKILEDDQTLVSKGVQDENTIALVLRLPPKVEQD